MQDGGTGLPRRQINAHPEDVIGSGMQREGWEGNGRGLATKGHKDSPSRRFLTGAGSPFYIRDTQRITPQGTLRMSPLERSLKSSHLVVETRKQRGGAHRTLSPPPGERPDSARARQGALFPAARAPRRPRRAGPLRKAS